MGHSYRTLLWDTLVGHSCRTLLYDTLVGHSCGTLCGTLLWDTLVGLSSSSPDTARVLKLYYKVASSQLPRTTVVLQGRQFSTSSSTGQIALSPACRALNTHDLRRGLRTHGTNRTLACISRTRHARSPQRVARAWDKSHSRLHFAHSTRAISAEGCARMGQIALSPAFGALDTHDLRRGLRVKSPKRAFRTRRPQKLTRQSLQNERFVRDFLQKSSRNTLRSTHIMQPCQAVSRFQPLQTTSAHTPIPMGQRHSPLPQLTTSRFPAPATRIALPRFKARTKSCACHEK